MDSDGRINWDKIQQGLDLLGCIPGVGEVADLANAGISIGRGDYEGAALSAVSIIPVFGDILGKGGKVVRAGANLLEATTDIAKYSDDVAGAFKGTKLAIGTKFNKYGTLAERPNITPNFNLDTANTGHRSFRMGERGISETDIKEWIAEGIPFQQSEDKFLFVTKEGAVAALTDGTIVTAWSKQNYTDEMNDFIQKVFE